MTKNRVRDVSYNMNNRISDIVNAIQKSNTEISKTGAAYRDPMTIVYSKRAQEQLNIISKLKVKR